MGLKYVVLSTADLGYMPQKKGIYKWCIYYYTNTWLHTFETIGWKFKINLFATVEAKIWVISG